MTSSTLQEITRLEERIANLKDNLMRIARQFVGINRSMMTSSEWKVMVAAAEAVHLFVKLDEYGSCQLFRQPLTAADRKRIKDFPTKEMPI